MIGRRPSPFYTSGVGCELNDVLERVEPSGVKCQCRRPAPRTGRD
jgi:hypothetical protein